MKSPIRSIFVVGPSWVGDMVMAQSLFKVLRQKFPQAQIDVLAPAWSRPILEAMPEVRAAIDMPVGHGKFQWSVRKNLAKSIREKDYDWAIVLPNSFKSALIPWLARIPKRTGWTGELRFGLLNDLRRNKKTWGLMVERYVALAYAPEELKAISRLECPPPGLVPHPDWITQAREKFGITKQEKVLALCPGAEFGRAKKWPERHYAVVAKAHIEQGGEVWLFGSANDRASCEQIAAGLPSAQVRILAGQTSLQEAVALMSCVDQVVSNDSGLMHVAAALERPLVALYGSTSPQYTPPLNRQNEIIQAKISCSPCFKRECPYVHYKCLEEMEPVRVIEALRKLQVQSGIIMTNPKLIEDFEHFRNHCINMVHAYFTYYLLFNEDNRELLSAVAATFFTDVADIMQRDWLLQVCKLMDPESTTKKGVVFENITIKLINKQLDAEGLSSPSIHDLAKELLAYGEKIKPARDKRLAHFDREHQVNDQMLGATTELELEQFLQNIQKYCDEVGIAIGLGPLDFGRGGCKGDVLDLLKTLRNI